MPCPHCEAPLLGDPTICPECGKPLRAAAPQGAGHAHPAAGRPAPRQPVARPVAAPQPRAAQPAPGARPAAPGQRAVPPAPVARPAQPGAGQDIWGPLSAGAQSQPARPQQAVASIVDPNDPTPGMLEQTRLPDVGEVPPEPVPGMIDQRLFGAFVPADLPSDPMPDLEASAAADIQVEVEPMPGLENTMQEVVPGQAPSVATNEPIVGFIDSRLFGAYMPPNLETPPMEGVERTLFEGDADVRLRNVDEESDKGDGPMLFCAACGVEKRVKLCPNCGERMRPKPSK